MANEKHSSDAIRLLIIEGDERESNVVRNLLQELSHTFEIATARDLQGAINLLSEETFHMVLLNLMLPDSGGVFSLKRLIKNGLNVPVIIINGPEDQELMNAVVENGAQDYLRRGELGSETLRKAIDLSLRRYKLKKEQEAETTRALEQGNLEHLKNLVVNIEEEISSPVQKMQALIAQVREESVAGEPVGELLHDLIEKTMNTSEELRNVIVDLQAFSQELEKESKVSQNEMNKKCKVLVVEDEPEIGEMIAFRLRKLGHERVETALNGKEAYNKAIQAIQEGRKFDAVISDLRMPTLSGLDLLKMLRRNAFYEKTPFLMVTALDDKDSVQEAITSGVDEYLVKPFRQKDFDMRVSKILRKSA